MGINANKTKCLLFQRKDSYMTNPNIYLKNEILEYERKVKFLGITFDDKLTFEEHIIDVYERCQTRLNLLKAISGRTWGANSETLMYTYRTFIRPLIEYGCVLFAHSKYDLLLKLQAIETKAIKIAYDLPPWTTNYWCYTLINFPPILDRIKTQAKKFVQANVSDFVLKPYIDENKPSINGNHSAIYKALNW